MKTRFILNPVSGKNRRRPWLAPAIRDFIARHRLDATLVTTECAGHATQLAREALTAGCTRLVAVGGDGTINEVAQALIDAPAMLALVPCGSGNGLALHLGIPTTPRAALALLVDPTARTAAIDTGTANGHVFCNAMGIGFDAEISRRFNRLSRRGLWAYARTTLGALRQFRPETVRLTAGHGVGEEFPAFIVAVANSDQYGNRAYLAPRARVDDGLLDLVAVRPTGPVGQALLAARLFLGTFDRSPHVRRLTAARFTLTRRAAGCLHADGEVRETSASIEIQARPRSLNLLLPADAPVARVVPIPFALAL